MPISSSMDPKDMLALPMPQPNEFEAATVREYLTKLLLEVWDYKETFNGKYFFDDISCDLELYAALFDAGIVDDPYDYPFNSEFANELIRKLIKSL